MESDVNKIKGLLSLPKRNKVVSSMINEIGFTHLDDNSFDQLGTLEVVFYNDSTYRFFNVSYGLYKEFIQSNSKGCFLSKNIKGFFLYEKVK